MVSRQVRQSLGFIIEPCLPTTSKTAPYGKHWAYEIKHDGYRLIVQRQGARMKLYTRRGYELVGSVSVQ